MKRLVTLAVLLAFAAVAWAALSFNLSTTSGVKPVPVGITATKFPPPLPLRDPVAPPYIEFDRVDGDLVGTPPAMVYNSWKWTIRADRIVSIEDCQDPNFKGYLEIHVADDVEDGPVMVRGDLARVQAIIAQTTGTRTIAASFDEVK